MAILPGADEARQLLLAHTDRALVGSLDDPAVVAAVVGVERLVVATGSTDSADLRAAIEGRWTGTASSEVAMVVAESQRHVEAGLLRRTTRQGVDAAVLNLDAGNHPVVNDAALLRAAVRAAQRSINAMPYYRMRYGERGSRFASSDSAWLVSLAPLGEKVAVRQVQWLAGVLAGRGMPSWLLELHLEELVTQVREVGGDDVVGALPAAMDSLVTARRRHVDDTLLTLSDTWADEALGDDLPVARTGALLAAAIADVRVARTADDHMLVNWLGEQTDASATRVLLAVRDRIGAAAG